MSKLPWMKFYPSDWKADQLLSTCSIGARGLWLEMLLLMHEAAPRGSLLINGKQVGTNQLAALVRVKASEANRLLNELETAGVFSRDRDGTIYSRKMRRDEIKSETDKRNGRLGGNPALRGVNPPDNPDDTPPDKAHWHLVSGSGVLVSSLSSQGLGSSVGDSSASIPREAGLRRPVVIEGGRQ